MVFSGQTSEEIEMVGFVVCSSLPVDFEVMIVPSSAAFYSDLLGEFLPFSRILVPVWI